MLLGIAIGDALGNRSESLWPVDRRTGFGGEIRDYQQRGTRGETIGVPSDDTQLAFWTLEHLLEDSAVDLDRLSRIFATRQIYGIGDSITAFRHAIRAGEPWTAAAPRSAGNGALMRIAPALVPHVARPTTALWHDTAMLAQLTHNDTASVASCVAFVTLLWSVLQLASPPEPTWWANTFLGVVDDLCLPEHYRSRGGAFQDAGPFPGLVRARLERARCEGWDTETACNSFWSGAYLVETVPCVLWILERHAADPEEAIVRAVNDTHDNDTIAAIVGAAVGALHGADALPPRWRDGLSGRTTRDDDGQVQRLIARARERFWREDN